MAGDLNARRRRSATLRRRVAVALRVRLIPEQWAAHKWAMTVSRLLPFVIIAAALAAPALAAEPEAVATASGAGAPPTVAQQIDDYLKTSPAAALPKDDASGVTSGAEPRKIHGMFDVSAGSGGYRSAYVESEIPIGKTGTATIAVGETHFGNRFGGRLYPYGGAPYASQSLSLGLGFGGALDPTECRRLQGGEGGDPRFDPRTTAGLQRNCRAPSALDAPQ
jgi:hypothetical protein